MTLTKLVYYWVWSVVYAMTNDINSGGAINVPKDIAGIVERYVWRVLDNEKFWGAPMAARCRDLDIVARRG